MVSSLFYKRFRRNLHNGLYASMSGLAVNYFGFWYLLVSYGNYSVRRQKSQNCSKMVTFLFSDFQPISAAIVVLMNQ